jgi:hypothetical protein
MEIVARNVHRSPLDMPTSIPEVPASTLTRDQIQALHPETAARWIVDSVTLSKAQHQALVIACRDGGHVQAGTNAHGGHVERVSASALRALVRRGYLNHCFGSEGGMGGRLSQRALASLANSITEHGL